MKVVELAGVGPGPFCAMLLADLGADVLRIDRPTPIELGVPIDSRFDLPNRGRRSVIVDLKKPEGLAAIRRLIAQADVLIEGFRPGVAERLGVGPNECAALNPRLVYGRVTGWGREGPLAHTAGHDINYIALTGVLGAIGPAGGPPVVPLNLIADFAGGGSQLAFGIVAALFERERSGTGQVVDAAMIDGAASLMTGALGHHAAGGWTEARGSNVLDGGAPYYSVYETSDGRYVSVGALERRFYAELVRLMDLDIEDLPDRDDRRSWPVLRERFAAVFRTKTRDEWARVMDGSDACFAPVLSMLEAQAHRHHAARGTFVEIDGVQQPGPTPRFSRTQATVTRGPARPGEHTREALRDWGFADLELDDLSRAGVIA